MDYPRQQTSSTLTSNQDPGGVDVGNVPPQQPFQNTGYQAPIQAQPEATAPQATQQSAPDAQPPQQPDQNPTQAETQANSDQNSVQNNYIPVMDKPMPEETLLEWQAPSRPFKQRKRQYFTTIGLICVLIALILLFAGQLLPVAVIAAVFFLYYVLNSTPPGLVNHKLTTYGIWVENNLYYWDEMGRFWFTEKFGVSLLHIEVARFPNRLTLLLGDITKEDMTLVLSEVLLNQTPPPTAYEKAAQWLQEKLPIDIES